MGPCHYLLLLLRLLERGGQPVGKVGPIAIAAEIIPNAPSSVLVKRKRDDAIRSLGRKKSKAPISFRSLR